MRDPIRAAAAIVALFVSSAGFAAAAAAQSTSSSTALPQGTNLLNPAVSVIGWFQGEAGDQLDQTETSAFSLREAELGLQANVDPYSRADFFISVNPTEGVDLEEGYLTLLSLPAGLTAKLGKFRGNFGKFNRTHPPETPFADRPLAAERFFGEEGLSAEGVSASWLIPRLPFYANLDGEVTNTPDSEGEPVAFARHRGKDLLFLGRLSTFFDLSEASNVAFGGSYANGANGPANSDSIVVPFDQGALRARVVGADVTFRWKNPRRAIYRSFIAQAEWMQRTAESEFGPDVTRTGGYAWGDLQFARRWHVGGRYDWSDRLGAAEEKAATGV
ncbi:MAG TPA: hypothetical protein VFU59_08470, partial [Candidatus Eisenbacteria bacterium]|nr:hypothetical protein [Candidatus Eisenbacteria bacterium]